MYRLIAATLIVLGAPAAIAQDADCDKLKDTKTAQALSLEDLEREFGECVFSPDFGSSAPMVDPRLAGDWVIATYAADLQQLKYGVIDEAGRPFDHAIREFQAERGEPVTGKLTFRQIGAIRKLKERKPSNFWMSDGTSSLDNEGDKPDFFRSGDYLTVTGSWWLDGSDKIADPINKHRYDCDLSQLTCHHSEASVMTLPSGDLALTLHTEELRIARAELPIVEIVPYDQPCRRPVVTINIDRQEVFQVTTQVSGCPYVPDLAAPRVARLRSPSIQSEQLRKEAEDAERSLTSRRWMKMEDDLRAAVNSKKPE